MKLIELWRHGDREGIIATQQRVQKAQRVVHKLRAHLDENHLGDALRLAYSEPKKRR